MEPNSLSMPRIPAGFVLSPHCHCWLMYREIKHKINSHSWCEMELHVQQYIGLGPPEVQLQKLRLLRQRYNVESIYRIQKRPFSLCQSSLPFPSSGMTRALQELRHGDKLQEARLTSHADGK